MHEVSREFFFFHKFALTYLLNPVLVSQTPPQLKIKCLTVADFNLSAGSSQRSGWG